MSSRRDYSLTRSTSSSTNNTCLPSNCELRVPNFYIAVLLEGVGLVFLVFIGGSMFIKLDVKKHDFVLETAIVYGVTLASLTQCLKDISGSHLNPAITLAYMITRRVSLLRGVCYIIFQCGGSILGTMLLREMVPSSREKDFAMTRLSKDVTIVVGIVYEMIFMLIYSILYFSFTSRKTKSTFKEVNAPLAIGLFYGISHIVIVEQTGCSLNPARSLGPAVVKQDFRDIWIYVAGPILASCFGVLMHDLVLKKSRNSMYPRARSLSLVCCNPSREEVIIREQHQGYDTNYTLQKEDAV